MKKSFYNVVCILALITMPMTTNAAYSGPTGAPTTGNTPGSVWLNPSSQQTGTINVSSDVQTANNVVISNGKAINTSLPSGSSNLYVSNYGSSATGFTMNLVGDLTITGLGLVTTGTLRVGQICLTGVCRNSWPSGSGGTIGGSGTANYHTKFTAGSTIGNSIVYDNGTNVGIGNTTVGAKLTIVTGATDPSTYDDGKALFASAATAGPNVAIADFRHDNLSQGVGIGYASVFATGANASQNLEVFSRGTAPLMFNVSGGGNVGVGTATVTNKLQVGGGTRAAIGYDNLYGAPTNAAVDSNGDKLVFYNGSSQTYRIGLGVVSDIWYQSAGSHRFLTGASVSSIGNETLFLSNLGSVGVGTTAPAYKLDVNGDIAGNWLRSRGATGWYNETYGGGMHMTDASWVRTYNNKSFWAGAGLMGSDGGLTIGYGGAGSPAGGAIIAGSVGIGTTGPASKLEVREDGAGNAWRARIASANATSDRQVFLGTWNGNSVVGSHNLALNAWMPLYVNAVDATNGSTVIMSGPVGIGTTNPTNGSLEVQRSGGNAIYGQVSGGAGVRGVAASGWGVYGEANSSGDGVHGVNRSSGGNGVYGEALGPGAANANGVRGDTTATAGGSGVFGYANAALAYGVSGINPSGHGVRGSSSNYAYAGVYGDNSSGSGAGVQGVNMNGGGVGVQANGGMYGVYGVSDGFGVYGYSAGGRGVYGNGGTYGIQGQSSYAGVYSWGGSYSFYGGGGEMYNAGLVRSGANGAPYFCGGDDACFWDINEGNMVGIRGVGDGTVAGLRLGSTGGALYGRDGRIGIGTGSPATTLSLYSGSEVYTQTWLQQNDANCGYAATAWTDGNFYLNRWCGGASASAYMTAAGNWVAYSDRDLKTDIEKIHYGIDEVMKLKPVTYTRKDDKDHTKLIGFIAQDVKEIMPEFVTGKAISEGGTGLGLNYSGLTTVLAGGIQDQQKEIDELKAQNADLLKRLEALEAKVK